MRLALKRLGPEFPSGVSLRSFRRSLATTMAQRGASLRQLQTCIDVSESDEAAALLLLD